MFLKDLQPEEKAVLDEGVRKLTESHFTTANPCKTFAADAPNLFAVGMTLAINELDRGTDLLIRAWNDLGGSSAIQATYLDDWESSFLVEYGIKNLIGFCTDNIEGQFLSSESAIFCEKNLLALIEFSSRNSLTDPISEGISLASSAIDSDSRNELRDIFDSQSEVITNTFGNGPNNLSNRQQLAAKRIALDDPSISATAYGDSRVFKALDFINPLNHDDLLLTITEVYFANTRIAVWDTNGQLLHRKIVETEQLNQLIEKIRSSLTFRESSNDGMGGYDFPSAYLLFQLMFDGAEDIFNEANTISVVADSDVDSLPLSILTNRNPDDVIRPRGSLVFFK